MQQAAGVTANVVWYAVKRCAGEVGINNPAPLDLKPHLRSAVQTNRAKMGYPVKVPGGSQLVQIDPRIQLLIRAQQFIPGQLAALVRSLAAEHTR